MDNHGTNNMGRVTVSLTLANNRDVLLAESGQIGPDQVKRVQLSGIVDTGAARLVLPESVVTQLGLPSAGETKVRYADGRVAKRQRVKNVWLELQGRSGDFSAIVEHGRTDALVGAIVLEELDLVVDCTTQTLHPRDPNWIISEIE